MAHEDVRTMAEWWLRLQRFSRSSPLEARWAGT